jgi:hypothetical protein
MRRRFRGGLAQQSLDVGDGVAKLDVDEGVVSFDIGHEQLAPIPFQPLDLKTKVVGQRLNSSPLGQMQLLP